MRNQPPELFLERFNALLAEGEAQGESISKLAAATGIHRSAFYRWREGSGAPEGSSLAALADHWGVTMDWLWGRPGYPKKHADSGEELTPQQEAAHDAATIAEQGLRAGRSQSARGSGR